MYDLVSTVSGCGIISKAHHPDKPHLPICRGCVCVVVCLLVRIGVACTLGRTSNTFGRSLDKLRRDLLTVNKISPG